MNILITPNYVNKKTQLDPAWLEMLTGTDNTVYKYDTMLVTADNYDVLLLTGGNDIVGYEKQNPSDVDRDTAENALIQEFIKAGKSIIGVCRGAHLLNIYFGGTLEPVSNHDGQFHMLKSVTSHQPGLSMTLSYHRWGIQQLGKNLSATWLASKDDTIEAFEHQTLPIYGILWHPERTPHGFIPNKIKDILCLNY